MTIEAWVRTVDAPPQIPKAHFIAAIQNRLRLLLVTQGGDWSFRVEIHDSNCLDDSYFIATSPQAIAHLTWTHVAVTISDNVGGEREVALYQDAAQVALETVTDMCDIDEEPLNVGNIDEAYGPPDEAFDHQVDELRFSSVVRSY